ncbi:leucine-rich repeat domain-containing protein [Flavobacterium sp. LAR06]|uniref:leucine-rich repeat domain-containing protein n=1 Tax=Flavobacterium sp. LAR06 TaxID=3064897 RepID=UPI0035BF0F21
MNNIEDARARIAMTQRSGATSLDLSNLLLNNESLDELIHDTVRIIPNLTELNLSNNPFQQLPGSLNQLSSLTRLNVSDTDVAVLPVTFRNLQRLQRLDVANTHITARTMFWLHENLPDCVVNCDIVPSQGEIVIENTSASNNVTIGDIDVYPQDVLLNTPDYRRQEYMITARTRIATAQGSVATSIDLSNLLLNNESLDELIHDIARTIPNLTVLDLSFNLLQEFPDSIIQLTGLERLNLSGTQIRDLPESLGQLQNLTHLDLSSNRIPRFPDSIGELLNLRELNASGTLLIEVPETLGNLQNLQRLYLDNCPISETGVIWLMRTFPNIEFNLNMIAHESVRSIKDVLKDLYPDEQERSMVKESLENNDIDQEVTIIYGGSRSVNKPAKEAIVDFLCKTPRMNSEANRQMYKGPIKDLISDITNQSIPQEDRLLILGAMTASMGDCNTPVTKYLTNEAARRLLSKSNYEELSEFEQALIEREAVEEKLGRLKGHSDGEKTESVQGLSNTIYWNCAETNDRNKDMKIVGDRTRLPSKTAYIGLGFQLLEGKSELLREHVRLVCQTDDNNEPLKTAQGKYQLDRGKIKKIREEYMAELGYGTKEHLDREKYMNQYKEDLKDFIKKNEIDDIYITHLKEAEGLLDTNAHKKELKSALGKEGIVVKEEYTKFLEGKTAAIKNFMEEKNQKNDSKRRLARFTTPLNLDKTQRSRSESPNPGHDRRDGEKESKARSVSLRR